MSNNQAFDPYKIRQDFHVLSRTNRGKPLIYLDNAATSQKPQSVIDAFQIITGHPTQMYIVVFTNWLKMLKTFTEIQRANRRLVWCFYNGNHFYRGATEGLNLIARSFAEPILEKGDMIILTEMEHHANIVPWQMVAKATGTKIEVVPILDDGSLDRDQLTQFLSQDNAKILSLCHISNVLGTVNPVKEITKEAHTNGVKVVLDGAQSVPHSKINLKDLGCDFFVFSGHKLFAPMGIGVVYAKNNLLEDMIPYQGGGDMIDQVSFSGTSYASGVQKFEAGTPNVSGARGLGEAVKYLQKIDFFNADGHEKKLLQLTRELINDLPGLVEHGTTTDKAGVFCFTIVESTTRPRHFIGR